VTVVFLTTTGAGTWPVPSDWNSSANTIECIGAGAGGGGGNPSSDAGGGGGGAYSKISNLTGLSGNISFSVGAGGGGGTSGNGTLGGDTWFNSALFSSSSVGAKGGSTNSGARSSIRRFRHNQMVWRGRRHLYQYA